MAQGARSVLPANRTRRDRRMHAIMPEPLDTLQTPSLLLDEARLRANAERMRAHLAGLGVRLRPHLKTAKSLEVGRIAMASRRGRPSSRP